MQDLGGSTGARGEELLLSPIRQRSIECIHLVKDVFLSDISWPP
jgi:hypothetical protein